MENYESEFIIESDYLQQTIDLIKRQLFATQERKQKDKNTLISSSRDMWENASHSAGDFDRVVELSQYFQPLVGHISSYESGTHKIQSLKRMLHTPYFARIDFKMDDEEVFEKIYIGRSTLMDERTDDIYVYDWRSPIASLFYRFETGKVYYQAPVGTIKGEVNLKRQYEIKNGILEYLFDADVQIVDEFLRKMLSKNTSAKMKTIVETIQKDQDIVIRDTSNDLLMVQGVAGSGKTSIALHRVAYLMYQGLSSKLSPSNIIILSPNTLFEQYISNVLPELGEENVVTVVFEDFCKAVLKDVQIHFQTRNEFLEKLIICNDLLQKSIMKSSMQFKSSRQFIEILNRYFKDLEHRKIDFTDVYYNGQCIANGNLLKAKVLNGNKNIPLALRMKQLESTILETVHKLRKSRLINLEDFVGRFTEHLFETKELARMLSIYESTVLIKNIRKFTEIDYLKFYKQLLSDRAYFYGLAKGIELPENIEEILDYTNANLQSDYLQYEDALALTYFILKLNGYSEYKDIRQLVVDEAQDYYPIHFEILKIMFAKARYTVLGDINQTIEKKESLTLYDELQDILQKEKSTLITMSKSFRCTDAIIKYSSKFVQPHIDIKSFSRNGDYPKVHYAENFIQLDELLINEVVLCKEKGYQSIGLICKSQKDANALYCRLSEKLDIQLINSDSMTDIKGIFIIPVYLAKGLEFDAVLICDADNEHYVTEDDKKLFYIACTRALHRLNLFYTVEISPLL